MAVDTVRETVPPLDSVELRKTNAHGFRVTVNALEAIDAVIGYTGLNVAVGKLLESAKVTPVVPLIVTVI
jgi:hypothetical protein